MGNSTATRLAAIVLVFVIAASSYASAEIPHENFNLVSSSIDVIVQMLNQTINATELALVSCIDQNPYDGERYLQLVDTILEPVGMLIIKIQEIGGIETNLTYLTPPFENLSEGGHDFVAKQSSFLFGIADLRTLIGEDLTPIESYNARQQLTQLRMKVVLMNDDLDDMDTAADEIANLTVLEEHPFDTTYLKELIDRLRMTLLEYLDMLGDILWNIKWIEPFITLGMDKDVYYLGEDARGFGFVYDGDKPLANADVYIDKDNTSFNFTKVVTDANGGYEFTWSIPRDPAALGNHSFLARVWMNSSWYMPTSREYIRVEKIPTYVSISLDGKRFSPDQTVNATAKLVDYRGGPVVDYNASLSHIVSIFKGTPPPLEESVEFFLDDAATINGTTTGFGTFTWPFSASTLEYGTHGIYAKFNGSPIYQPSKSGTASFDVNYQTDLRLNISDHRVKPGIFVDITAWLDNASQPLSDRTVTVYFDDSVLITNKTGADGSVVYRLNTTNISTGTHVLRAYFASNEKMYTSAVSDDEFLMIYVDPTDTNNPPPPPPPDQNKNNWLPDWIPEWLRDWLYQNWLWVILLAIIIMMIVIVLIATDTLKNVRDANLRRKKRTEEAKALALAGKSSEIFTLGATPAVSGTNGGFDYTMMPPRTAIVMLYNALLSHLSVDRKMTILPTMTARDIARMLTVKEFPAESVGQVTKVFERAKYSAENITKDDWNGFERAVEGVRGFTAGVAA
jgi:hypothetical protein